MSVLKSLVKADKSLGKVNARGNLYPQDKVSNSLTALAGYLQQCFRLNAVHDPIVSGTEHDGDEVVITIQCTVEGVRYITAKKACLRDLEVTLTKSAKRDNAVYLDSYFNENLDDFTVSATFKVSADGLFDILAKRQ